ncbi:MAG: 2Fe-2S iron-sulfur cluster binding domain-containing protein [Crenarchaeota archaeon]|nr:2Fe-2S iron-sulfur cluster binding domain-containing protein [Thermoproteota archaeon]
MVAAGEFVLRVRRFDPESGRRWVAEYRVPRRRGMTVLDALLYVKERLDPTLSFRYSCRMGACGSCGVEVNGVPRLACQTQVSRVLRGGVVEVGPLSGYPVVRDLVVDMSRPLGLHASVRPTVVRRSPGELEDGSSEFLVEPGELLGFYQYSLCIMCGLCNAACPVYTSNPRYMGPMVLTHVYRWVADPRDEARLERVAMVASPDGCLGCHFAASCSAVCPKAVDPASAIQRLRRLALAAGLGLLRPRRGAPAAEPGPRHGKPPAEGPPAEAVLPGVRLEELEAAEPLEDVDPEAPPESPLRVPGGGG